jgi:AbrB family looped-hinge helix DNA binding protein
MATRRRDAESLEAKNLFPRAKVSSKGWVVIPKEIREEMGLRPGDEVQFSVLRPLPNMKQDPALNVLQVIRIPDDPVALVSGMFKRTPGKPLMTERLIEERRREAAEEERKVRGDRNKRRRSA